MVMIDSDIVLDFGPNSTIQHQLVRGGLPKFYKIYLEFTISNVETGLLSSKMTYSLCII